ALGGEAEDLILEHVELGMLEEFLGIRGVLHDVEHFAQPAILLPVRRTPALLVAPMRGDAEFGDLMHLVGANLDFDAMALRTKHSGMQRAVTVWLWSRDVILEAVGNHRIAAMNDP